VTTEATVPSEAPHVAIVHDRLDGSRGGAERYLEQLAARLVGAGHPVSVYGRSFGVMPAGVRPVRIAAPGLTRVARERRFAADAVAAARVDGAAVVLAARHVPGADIYQPHGGAWDAAVEARREATVSPMLRSLKAAWQRVSPRHRHFRAVERQLLARPDVLVLAVSDRVRDDLIRIEPEACARIVVLPPALEIGPLLALRSGRAEGARASEPERPSRILFCGNDFALKGLSDALAAFRRSDAAARGARLLVAGRGRPGRWQGEARSLGIASQVEWVGAVPDLGPLLARSDLLLHPTWFDPCALVCLEALAAGVAVVTTSRNGAAPWVLRAGGRVVARPDDRAELAASIDALLADPSSPLPAAEVVAEFGWDAHLRRFVRLLASAGARKSS
jgi:UDP-glucose:(heptosyl)LPS alpha-1,3-glucosyltransferase